MDLKTLRKENNQLYDHNLSLCEKINRLEEDLERARRLQDSDYGCAILTWIAIVVLMLVPGIWDNFITLLQFFGVLMMAAVVTKVGNIISALMCLGIAIWYFRKKTYSTRPELPNR